MILCIQCELPMSVIGACKLICKRCGYIQACSEGT